ncbi:hypothetical protein MR857_13225 [bacterium]|nr:hypothetical protein [bacterium]MDY3022368.1 DUF6673 family protein [Oliverpabstia sp.]
MKGKILGVTVELDHLTNPDVMKRYEDSIPEILEIMNKSQECKSGSEGIRIQCQAVIDAFTEMFGEEKTKEILGEQTNVLKCMDAFDEYVNLFPKQVIPGIEKRMEKYSRNRLEGR